MKIENRPQFVKGVLMMLFCVVCVVTGFVTQRWRLLLILLIATSFLGGLMNMVMAVHVDGEDEEEA